MCLYINGLISHICVTDEEERTKIIKANDQHASAINNVSFRCKYRFKCTAELKLKFMSFVDSIRSGFLLFYVPFVKNAVISAGSYILHT